MRKNRKNATKNYKMGFGIRWKDAEVIYGQRRKKKEKMRTRLGRRAMGHKNKWRKEGEING